MSSGSLPLSNYHRAESLGCGTYGSVLTVYNDDGEQFALKLFMEDSDDEVEEDDDEEEESKSCDTNEYGTMDLSAQREISILRLLRDENSHTNIINIHDIKTVNDCEEEEECADDTMGYLGIAMPLFSDGTLSNAIDSNKFMKNKRWKVHVAHGILSAVAFLHHNGIIHRDIKGDNVMLQLEETQAGYYYKPVLIDFSLAKIVHPEKIYKEEDEAVIQQFLDWTSSMEGEDTHTPSVGTPTYKAPEVVNEESYGLPSDLYSVGVILFELLRGQTLEAETDKGAVRILSEKVHALPNQPFANLIRGLLEVDPLKRWSAKEALECELYNKFGFNDANNDLECKKSNESFRWINIKEALPLDEAFNFCDENEKKFQKPVEKQYRGKKKMMDPGLLKRYKTIQKIAKELDSQNPLTVQAALTYSVQLQQLEDNIDDLSESQALVDTVVLAHKFFECEMWSLHDLQNKDTGVFKESNWTIVDYQENESTIWMLMDFCLYPRKLCNVE